MKKNTALFFAAILLITVFSGCASKVTDISIKEPDILQVRNICNLATLDCYYHNVAKSVKTAPSGITHLGEKDRTFWIEYTGVARLGIDMSKVEMKIHGTDIELNMPKATVLSITIDKQTLGEDSYIASPDGLNKNKITANDQTQAISTAQKDMEETVRENSSLLLSTQNRAKILIENYIHQLGEAAGIEYNIKWTFDNRQSAPQANEYQK